MLDVQRGPDVDAGGQQLLVILAHVMGVERLPGFVPGTDFFRHMLLAPRFVSLDGHSISFLTI